MIRIDDDEDIGLAGPEVRVRLIERLRELGFQAVGAESLVFDKDESNRAQFLLGGVVRELECRRPTSGVRCRVGIEWQLLDVHSDSIVYKALARGAVFDVPTSRVGTMGGKLLVEALGSVTKRARFLALLGEKPDEAVADPQFPAATFSACAAPSSKISASADGALRAALVVRSGNRLGSAFFISPDGLALTAAHVLDGGSATLRTRDGTEIAAVPVRVAANSDVALLRPLHPLTPPGCLLARPGGEPAVGSELYAVGTPTSEQLAFSLTRGIVSAFRDIDGIRLLQTDAPVNQGNSGGPMLDAEGRVVAIADAKLAGRGVEGIAFGIPIGIALSALGLEAGTSTDRSLLTGGAADTSVAKEPESVTDDPDPMPSLDPEGDALRAAQEKEAVEAQEEHRRREQERRRLKRREELRDSMTPGYVRVLYWGGATLAVAGGVTALYAYQAYDESSSTHAEYDRLAVYNTVGWSACALGIGAFTAAVILRPPLPELPDDSPAPTSRFVLQPGSVRWETTF